MLLVGLTGGIGAGKSTVAELLTERGAVLVDGDHVAREVVEPGQPALAAIVERFGPEVLAPTARSTAEARAEAFATPRSGPRSRRSPIPAIDAEFAARRCSAAPADGIVVHDVPLLVESKQAADRGYEVVIVVEAPRDLRLDRLEERGLERADAEARMAAQATDEERRAVATHLLRQRRRPRAPRAPRSTTLWADLRATQADRRRPAPSA